MNNLSLNGIQALRAIAANMVMLAHISDRMNAHNIRIYDGWIGGAGVDIFFIISGFIMAKISLLESAGIKNSLLFMARRISRIIPIYWIVTLLTVVAWYLTKLDMYSGLHANHEAIRIVKSFLFFPPPIVVVGWTLTYEMCFYLAISTSLLIKVQYRFPSLILIMFTASVLESSFTTTSLTLDPKSWPRTLILEFLIGIVLQHISSRRAIQLWVGFSGLIIGCAIFYLIKNSHDFNHGHPIWILASTGIVVMFLVEEKIRWPSFLIKLGDSSYSLYLLHLYIILMIELIFFDGDQAPSKNIELAILFIFINIIFINIASVKSYQILEHPLTIYLQSILNRTVKHN